MRHRSKRFLGILLSLALVLGLMPGMGVTALAAEYQCPNGHTNLQNWNGG